MKKRWWALGAVVVVGAVFALGPRPVVDTDVPAVTVPDVDKLDAYVAQRESLFADITPGAEAAIVWADPAKKTQTPLSIVYLHGFSATRMETAPLCDLLAKQLGANLFYARLAGHGRPGAHLGSVDVKSWLQDGAEALAIGRRLGERVIVVSASTGSTLATWLVNEHEPSKAKIAANIFISPNFAIRVKQAKLLTMPWGLQLARLVNGPERSWQARSEAQERYWTTRYPIRGAVTMQALLDLFDGLDLSGWSTPILCIYSQEDRVVDPVKIALRFADFGGDANATERFQLMPFEGAEDEMHHVLAGDILSPTATPKVLDAIVGFLETVGVVP